MEVRLGRGGNRVQLKENINLNLICLINKFSFKR